MATDRPTLKSYFQTGDRPTEAHFAELIDNLVHQNDSLLAILQAQSPGTFNGNQILLDNILCRYATDINTNGASITINNNTAVLHGKAMKKVKSATKPALPSNVTIKSGFFEPNVELEYEFICTQVNSSNPANNAYELRIKGNQLKISLQTSGYGSYAYNTTNKVVGFAGVSSWAASGDHIFELRYKKTAPHISQIVMKVSNGVPNGATYKSAYFEIASYGVALNNIKMRFIGGSQALYDTIVARYLRDGEYDVYQIQFSSYPAFQVESITAREIEKLVESYSINRVAATLGADIARLT